MRGPGDASVQMVNGDEQIRYATLSTLAQMRLMVVQDTHSRQGRIQGQGSQEGVQVILLMAMKPQKGIAITGITQSYFVILVLCLYM